MPRSSDTLDSVLRRGLPAAIAVATQARRRIADLVKKLASRSPSSTADLVRLARVELARTEPVLARVVTDSLLAAWIAAARPVAKDAVPSAPSLASPLVLPPSPSRSTSQAIESLAVAAMTGDGFNRSRTAPPFSALPPPPPPLTFPFPGDTPEPEPVVRFPAAEAGLRDLSNRRILLPGEYNQLASDAKAAAFTVARVLTRDAVQRVHDAVVQDVRDGGTLREFRVNVADALAGVLSDSQVETVYRTQVGQAHAAGLRDVLEHPLVADEFPFVAYNATHDSRCRPEHLEMERRGINGTNVYYRDDPVIQKFWAPWAWNCRCVMIPFTVEDAAAAGVMEARRWLASGQPPRKRTFVKPPPFDVPKGWPVRGGGIQSVAE